MTKARRKIEGVIDGDTLRLSRKLQGTDKIRLANVQAPEMGSRAGTHARNVLRGMAGGKNATIDIVGRSYDRLVANVTVDRKGVNKRMKKRGY